MIHRHKGNRWWRDNQKAKRKQNICHFYEDAVTGKKLEWYDHFGQYRKGKIHCSCHLCTEKTNDAFYGRRNYKPCDRRKINALEEREEIFKKERED